VRGANRAPAGDDADEGETGTRAAESH